MAYPLPVDVTQKKFGPFERRLKTRLKNIRIENNLNLDAGARLLGMTRKNLEDIEATRNYGCYITALTLNKYMVVYSAEEITDILAGAHRGKS